MISSADGAGWVQTGYYVDDAGGPTQTFVQDRRDATQMLHTILLGNALNDGEEHQFWVKWENLNLCFCEQEIYDGQVLWNTPWNPYQYWQAPFLSSWEGETQFCESDVPGHPGLTARFSRMELQLVSDDTWTNSVPSPLYASSDCQPRYGKNSPGWQGSQLETVFDIWTN